MPFVTDPKLLPDIESLVLARLLACYQDMGPEIQRAVEQPPLTGIHPGELPMATTTVGPLLTPIESGGENIEIFRRFGIFVYMFPMMMGLDDEVLGAEPLSRTRTVYARLRNYFTVHTRLSTSTLPELEHVQRTVYQCDGAGQRQGPGGIMYQTMIARLDVQCMIKIRGRG